MVENLAKKLEYCFNQPVSRAVTRSSLEWEVMVQILGWSNWTQCYQLFAIAAMLLWKKMCCLGPMTRRWIPPTCYTLQRNTVSIMKDLISSACFRHSTGMAKMLKVSARMVLIFGAKHSKVLLGLRHWTLSRHISLILAIQLTTIVSTCWKISFELK